MFYTDSLSYRNAAEVNSAMGRVYKHMSLAVLVSMLVSYYVGTTPALVQFFFTGFMKWITVFSPLVAIFAISFILNAKPSKTTTQLLLYGFAAIMGVSFSSIFTVFKWAGIVNAFMGGVVLFSVMSFYGYFTKRSLDSLGKFLFVGLICIIIASVINLFIGSTIATMIVSALAIIIFMGLTAVDTQRIREMVMYDADTGTAEVTGALTLYMNFINIFLSLLQLFGDKQE